MMFATESDSGSTARTRAGRRNPTRPATRVGFPAPSTPPVDGLPSPTVSAAEVIALRPSPRSVTYTHESIVEGDDADALWDLYAAAMRPVDDVAAMQHLEDRDVVVAAFAEPEITKVIARVGSTPVGLGMITARLDLINGISPGFFANQFPQHDAEDRIFYLTAVLVDPDRRGKTVFSRLLNELTHIAERVGGVMIFDTCSFNREHHRMDTVVQRIVDRFPRSSWKVIDQQTWYAAELPIRRRTSRRTTRCEFRGRPPPLHRSAVPPSRAVGERCQRVRTARWRRGGRSIRARSAGTLSAATAWE